VVYGIGNKDMTNKSNTALYLLFKKTLSDYNTLVAKPKIMSKSGKDILNEFALHWHNYTILTYWLIKPFSYLVFCLRFDLKLTFYIGT